MEVRDKLYDLTNDIDNIGLYDPEKRRKEEEELKIEYHTKLALEKGIEKGIEKGLKNGSNNEKKTIAKAMLSKNMEIPIISEITGLSENQIMMLN